MKLSSFFSLGFCLSIIACHSPVQINTVKVSVAGSMRKIMHGNELGGSVRLDSLLTEPHIYGLGPAEGLKGELLVLDSKAYHCSVQENSLKLNSTYTGSAAMLVWAQVPDWHSHNLESPITSLQELEETIAAIALTAGKSADEAFPFLLQGTVEELGYHVIEWPEGEAHSIDRHKEYAYNGILQNQPVKIVGFFSHHHQGIFTHHSSYIHMHVLNEANAVVGHIDRLQLPAGMELLLAR